MGKTSGVAIPKQVYQLTHNYRSHAGILSLASSILDLMIEFFPESFEKKTLVWQIIICIFFYCSIILM
jgi:hypothetical protein